MIMSAVLAVTACSVSAGEINPSFLRCEYERNPVGVGADKPVLMWEAKATDPKARGLRQTAYRITVATSKSTLEKDSGDLWDSGKVKSGETLGIVYGGKPLAGLQQIWWKVKLWDLSAFKPSPRYPGNRMNPDKFNPHRPRPGGGAKKQNPCSSPQEVAMTASNQQPEPQPVSRFKKRNYRRCPYESTART